MKNNPPLAFDAARARIEKIIAAEDAQIIHPASHTRLWAHAQKTARAILCLHGYTDSTQQFYALGDLMFQRGYNVFVPRAPHHGYRDRMSAAHGALTIAELQTWANDALDLALGLGEKITVMGLSMGGVMATWLAETRAELDQAILLSPAYGTSAIPPRVTRTAARAVNHLPNLFIWWDPRVRAETGIAYAYPRFATRTLARLFLFSAELLQTARQQPPAARQVWMVTNANDFAISNTLCKMFADAWRAHATDQIRAYEFPRALGLPHDLLDPIDAAVKPEAVYPQLIKIVAQAETGAF